MDEQQEIDNYKDILEGIANKCRNIHHTSDGDLCADCQNEIFRLSLDLIINSGIELKIEKEYQQMGIVCISRKTMNAFDLHVNDIAEIASASGGRTVAIVHEGKEESTIHMSLMTALNLHLDTPRDRKVKTEKDIFIMRKIETIPATKVTVEPKPGQYPVSGYYLAEKLKGVPLMSGDHSIVAPHPVYENGVLAFLIRDVSIQTRSDKTIDTFYRISDDDKTIAAVIDSATEFEIINEKRGRGAFQVSVKKKK
jgi:hypothetical protein